MTHLFPAVSNVLFAVLLGCKAPLVITSFCMSERYIIFWNNNTNNNNNNKNNSSNNNNINQPDRQTLLNYILKFSFCCRN